MGAHCVCSEDYDVRVLRGSHDNVFERLFAAPAGTLVRSTLSGMMYCSDAFLCGLHVPTWQRPGGFSTFGARRSGIVLLVGQHIVFRSCSSGTRLYGDSIFLTSLDTCLARIASASTCSYFASPLFGVVGVPVESMCRSLHECAGFRRDGLSFERGVYHLASRAHCLFPETT